MIKRILSPVCAILMLSACALPDKHQIASVRLPERPVMIEVTGDDQVDKPIIYGNFAKLMAYAEMLENLIKGEKK